MKRFAEDVPRQLGEILIKHGRATLTNAKLCENLLKDYCPEHKEEIALLSSAVREGVASDLFVSQDGLQRDLLRALLVKRLRKAQSLSEGDARWVVESWSTAIRALNRADSQPPDPPDSQPNPSNSWSSFTGTIGQCSKPVRSIAVVDDTIASGGDDGRVCLWTDRVTILTQFENPVSALAFAPNGASIVAAARSEVFLIDVQSKEATLLGHAGKQPSLAFSPGGKSLAAASTDSPCEIRVWNLQTGASRVLKGEWKGPTSIAFSPDGSTIVAADGDRMNASIRLWDIESGTARVLGSSTRQITAVRFLSDGKRIATGSWDETVRLWNIQTGESRILGENCSCIVRLAISTKGDRIAASSLDGKIRVWDVDTGRSRVVGVCSGVNAVAFTDDDALVTGSDDGTVRVWELKSP